MGILSKSFHKKDIKEMVKENDLALEAVLTRENNLVAALESGKLKSPRLIAEAEAIRANRTKKEKKGEKKNG